MTSSIVITESPTLELSKTALVALSSIGPAIIEQIKQRVASGVGIHDTMMKSYEKTTAKKKGTTVRNLSDSGDMLASLAVLGVSTTGSGAGIAVGLTNSEAQRKAERNQAISPWLGLSPKDQLAIESLIKEELSKALRDQS